MMRLLDNLQYKAAINRHLHHDAYKVLAVLIPDSIQQLPALFKFRLQFMVFHHKSYSFLSRTVRLTNSNPKALLLGCRGTLAQNRGTMGVQIPFSFPKSLDFKPLQTKVRILPWQTKYTVIILLKFLSFAHYPSRFVLSGLTSSSSRKKNSL